MRLWAAQIGCGIPAAFIRKYIAEAAGAIADTNRPEMTGKEEIPEAFRLVRAKPSPA
jgi:hypothetical protein